MSDKFQVGDKVRVVRPVYLTENISLERDRVYTVTEVTGYGLDHGDSDYGINVDNGDGGYGAWDVDRFELVSKAGEAGQSVPAGVVDAHEKAAELFGLLATAAYLAITENKPGHLAFVKSLAEQVDGVMVALENEYPVLDGGIV